MFPDDATAIEAIAASFAAVGMSAEAAHCIGDGLVHVFGRAKVAALGFGPGRWTVGGAGPWNAGDATAVVDTFRVCTPNWKLLMVEGDRAGCVAAAIPDDQARALFVTLLERPSDDVLAAQHAACP